jgi:Kef-type K+ transport system membrane component KefB
LIFFYFSPQVLCLKLDFFSLTFFLSIPNTRKKPSYKGLLMGLFFMTVGMEISVGLFFARMRTIVGGIALLLAGKAAVMAAVGPLFGLSRLVAARAGLLLASGGEFAFVAFGEAQAAGILPPAVVQELFLVVALTMAVARWAWMRSTRTATGT